MNVPDLIGVEVLTPDGRGKILSLHTKRVTILLHRILFQQKMKGIECSKGGLHYSYMYKDVEVIKGQYCINDDRVKWQYEKLLEEYDKIDTTL
jgi:hypothetical protein